MAQKCKLIKHDVRKSEKMTNYCRYSPKCEGQ